MRTMLDLPDDVLRAVRRLAAVHHRSVTEEIADLLRAGLGLPTPKPSAPPAPVAVAIEHDGDGWPRFRVREDTPARQLTIEESLALEQAALLDEDLHRAGLTH